jgi:hypothetical protein
MGWVGDKSALTIHGQLNQVTNQKCSRCAAIRAPGNSRSIFAVSRRKQQLEAFRLAPWARRRRRDLLELLGHITKQGSSMLRFLLVEAAQVTVRSLPGWRRKYAHFDDAAWTQDGEGSHGAETGDSAVLDDAPGMGL